AQQPVGQAGHFLRPRGKAGGRNDALQPAAGQEEGGPRRITGRRVAEICRERCHLLVGGRRAIERFVQRREALHRSFWSSLPSVRFSIGDPLASEVSLSSPISPSYCVRIVPVSSPRVSARYRASASDQPCVTSTRL